MSKYLQQLRDDFERELDKQKETGDDPAARWLAIQAVARVLAGRRTKELPRLNRQALSQRSSGIALSLGLLFEMKRQCDTLKLMLQPSSG